MPSVKNGWSRARTPILLVRQGAQRQSIPDYLEPEELRALLSQLDQRFRVMVFLDAATGLRRSELLALKWEDVDSTIANQRSAFDLSECCWHLQDRGVTKTCAAGTDFWFPSSRLGSKTARMESLMIGYLRARIARVKPLLARYPSCACGAACCSPCGDSEAHRLAHVPHSFSTMLMANGENVKVVGELMRHANCRCTLEIYSQARIQAKRDAQHRVVEMIMPREREANDSELPLV